MSHELREAAQRVTSYVRARALMSNADAEEIGDITIMPLGSGTPVTIRLLASDLETLAAHAVGATPTEVNAEPENKYGGCPVLNCGYKIEDEQLPERPVANFGDDANKVINLVAESAEVCAVAAMIAHHVIDHAPSELMDTISDLRARLYRFEQAATPEGGDVVTVSRELYDELVEDGRQLAALHAAGVDNWEGYAEARSNR